jgi:hypothetical protein
MCIQYKGVLGAMNSLYFRHWTHKKSISVVSYNGSNVNIHNIIDATGLCVARTVLHIARHIRRGIELGVSLYFRPFEVSHQQFKFLKSSSEPQNLSANIFIMYSGTHHTDTRTRAH